MNATKRSFPLVPASRVAVGTMLLATVWLASPARASRALRAGEPPFLFGASYLEAPRPGEPIRIRISYSGFYDASAISDMRIDIPRGLEVVSGETERRATPSHDPWFLAVRPLHPGRFEIHGSIRTTAGDHVDEGEFILPFQVRPDAIVPELYRETRLERIERDRRYRYGYDYLVPLHGPQMVTQADIVDEGGKPTVLRSEDASCPACKLVAPVAVPVRALVDEDGTVLESEALPSEVTAAPEVVAAAQAAIRGWKFRPAHARGLVTRDRVDVQVIVH